MTRRSTGRSRDRKKNRWRVAIIRREHHNVNAPALFVQEEFSHLFLSLKTPHRLAVYTRQESRYRGIVIASPAASVYGIKILLPGGNIVTVNNTLFNIFLREENIYYKTRLRSVYIYKI